MTLSSSDKRKHRPLLFWIQGGKCAICGGRLDTPDDGNIDHIVPLSRGGADSLANLQLTHPECNAAKGNRTDQNRRSRGKHKNPPKRHKGKRRKLYRRKPPPEL